MDNHKTQHLVALAKEGDESALNQLCSVYGERVRRIIRLRLDQKLRPKLDSVDVVQDALILALGGLKDFKYRNEGDFLRWLSKIAENKLRDIFDKFHADKRDVHKEIPFKKEGRSTEGGSVGAAGPMRTTTPSVIACRKEALDKLEHALDKLKPEYKQVVVLKRIEGLSHAEIAEKLGKNTGAVRMLLARAMAALTIACKARNPMQTNSPGSIPSVKASSKSEYKTFGKSTFCSIPLSRPMIASSRVWQSHMTWSDKSCRASRSRK